MLRKTERFFYTAFLYEMRIWLGANSSAESVKRNERLIIPLNRNSAEGIIESANALKTLPFLKQTAQMAQYRIERRASIIR